MNFKSKAAYNAWLKYGHASGEFAKTPGNQPVSIQGKSHGVQHAFGGEMYAAGGSFNNPGFAKLPKDVQAKIKARSFADGGPMAQLTEFNEGGRHEENPIGGIPQGFAPDGQPNLVEQGETKLNSDDYIYSDTLKVTKDIALDFSLPKNSVGKTFAQVSKEANRPKSRRENDTIEQVAIKRDLDNLMQAQEEFKKRDLEKDMQMMMEKHPQEMQQMMAGAQMAQQGMPQEGMMPGQEMQGLPQEMAPEQQVPQSAEMGMPQGQPVDPNQIPPEMLAQMQGAQQGAPVMRMGGNIYMCGGKMYDFGGFIEDNNNTLAGAGKGALTGAAQGASMGSMFGPWGTAIGAAAGTIVGGVAGGIKGNKADKAENAAEDEANRLRTAQSQAINANALTPDMNTVVQTPNKGIVGPLGMMGQVYDAGGWMNSNANAIGGVGEGMLSGGAAGQKIGKEFDVAGKTPWGSIIGMGVGALAQGASNLGSGMSADEQAKMQQQALYDQGKLQRSQYNMMMNAPQMYQQYMMNLANPMMNPMMGQMNGAQMAKYGGQQYANGGKLGGFLNSNFSMYGNSDAHSFAEGGPTAPDNAPEGTPFVLTDRNSWMGDYSEIPQGFDLNQPISNLPQFKQGFTEGLYQPSFATVGDWVTAQEGHLRNPSATGIAPGPVIMKPVSRPQTTAPQPSTTTQDRGYFISNESSPNANHRTLTPQWVDYNTYMKHTGPKTSMELDANGYPMTQMGKAFNNYTQSSPTIGVAPRINRMGGNLGFHSFADGGTVAGPGDPVRYAFRGVTEFVYDEQGNQIDTIYIPAQEVERRYNAGERNEAISPYWSSDHQDFSTAPRYFSTQVNNSGNKVLIGYGANNPKITGVNAPRTLEKDAYIPMEGNFAADYDKEYQAYKHGSAGNKMSYEDWKTATGRATSTTGTTTTPSTSTTGATTAGTTATTGSTTAGGATTTTPSGTTYVTVHPVTGATARPGYHFIKNDYYAERKKIYDDYQANLAIDPNYNPAPTVAMGTVGSFSTPLGPGDHKWIGKTPPQEYLEVPDKPISTAGMAIVGVDASGNTVYRDSSGKLVSNGGRTATTTPTGGPVKATTTTTIVPVGGAAGTTTPATGTTGTTVIPGSHAYGGRLFNMPHSYAYGDKLTFEGDPIKGDTRINEFGNKEVYNGTEWELVTTPDPDNDREAQAQYESDLKSKDEKLKDRNLNLEMNQSLPEFLAVAAPAAYNLGQGIFGKVQQLRPQDYMVAANMKPYQYNIDPQLRAADQSFAQGQEALRNAGLGGGNYATNMQQLANARNQAIGGLYTEKQNADAASYNQAMAQNKAIESENLQRRMGVEDFNRQAKAAKTAMLQAGLQQLAQVSEGSQAKKIQIALMQALAPEFANTMAYNSIADQYLNLIKAKRKDKKDSKTTKG